MFTFILYLGVFIFIEIFYIFLGFKSYRHDEIDAGRNNFANALVFGIALIFSLAFSPFTPIMPYPLDVVTVVFSIAFIFIFYIFMVKEERDPNRQATYVFGEKLSLRYDMYRKLSHFIVVGIFLIYIIIGSWMIIVLNSWMALTPEFWNASHLESPESAYGQYTTMFFVGIAFIGLNIADFVRIMKPEAYPLKKVNRILRDREKGTMLGPQVSFSIGCISVIMIIGPYFPMVACAAMGISSFGDAAANIIGRRWGKHKLRGPKTWEGLLGGAAVSFIVSFLFLIYEPALKTFKDGIPNIATLNFGVPAIVALAGTLTFCFVDYFTPVISDNLLNAFLSASIMVITAFVLVLL
ncbi:MAG: dolichol kinase [Promethearchaeota archaeon CR_4]|nr:MAG: dolichol kinase [Candidatus Lokiarchaeota archaeon CR_4]